jgi:two-component system, NarL family, invasion response regulator UvrY
VSAISRFPAADFAGHRAVKILIVDDHPIVRSGLRRLLGDELDLEISEAADGRGAITVFREQRPNLVILDLNLPGISGLEVISRLKTADPSVRILILSMHDDLMHVTRALQAGAVGYIGKHAPPDEILTAIGRVAAGQTYVGHDIAEELVFASIQTASYPLSNLSSRDLEILRLLAEGFTLPRIADTVGVSYKTVANSCSQIKAKLGVASTADLIRIAIRSGLVSRDADLASRPFT